MSLLQLLGQQLPERYKFRSRKNGSSDDAENKDLGSMMDTQDNPERVSQIFQSNKTTLLGLHVYTIGYEDLLHNLMI